MSADLAHSVAVVVRSIRQRPIEFSVPVVCLAVVFLIGWMVIPYPWGLAVRDPESTQLMEQRIREALREGDTLDIVQDWVPLEEISTNLVRAVTVAEDHRFRDHRGIDWLSLAEEVHWTGDDEFSWLSPADVWALGDAFAFVWANRRELRGRSTITQQLAKNLYFGTNRSLMRKAMEFVVARRLERELDKDRILELYLNIAEWGSGLFGVEAASRTYFGISAASLTLAQSAALAATLPHPLTSNPARNPRRMLWRRDLILQRLRPSPGVPAEPLPLPDIEVSDPELAPLLELELPTIDSVSLDTVAEPPDTLPAPRSIP